MTRIRQVFVTLAYFVLYAPGTHAIADEIAKTNPPLVLDQLVQEALTENPEIQAAFARWESARARIPQVQTLPDPKILAAYRQLERREVMYGVSQNIPFPGKLALRGEIAANESDIFEQDYWATRLSTVADLKQAYYELHLVEKSIPIVEKSKRLLLDFEESAKARYAVGRAAQQDVFRAQTEISRLLARFASLAQNRKSLSADINRILNRHPFAPLGVPEEIRLSRLEHGLEELEARIDRSAPRLLAGAKNVSRSEKVVALSQREYFPNFEVTAAGIREEPSGIDGYQVMLNVEVPLYFSTKQREGVREAVAGRGAALDELQNIRQELLFRVKDEVAKAQRAEELVKILRDAIIPQARFTLASAQSGYAVGQVDFLSLLNSLLTLLDNEIELHAEMVEHEKALARIEGLIGEMP